MSDKLSYSGLQYKNGVTVLVHYLPGVPTINVQLVSVTSITCITTLHIRCSDCPRSSHPYFHNETSCSTMESNWWCSWAIIFRPHYNTTKPIAHSTRAPRLLSWNAEPVVELGPSQSSLAYSWSSRSGPSEQWVWKPCVPAQISFCTEERYECLNGSAGFVIINTFYQFVFLI